jgi:hypothetical protein
MTAAAAASAITIVRIMMSVSLNSEKEPPRRSSARTSAGPRAPGGSRRNTGQHCDKQSNIQMTNATVSDKKVSIGVSHFVTR